MIPFANRIIAIDKTNREDGKPNLSDLEVANLMFDPAAPKNLTPADVAMIRQAIQADVELDEPVNGADGDNEATNADFIGEHDDELGEAAMQKKAVAAALYTSGLSEDEISVIELSFWSQLPESEIATKMNMKMTETRSLRDKALRKLRHHLKSSYES